MGTFEKLGILVIVVIIVMILAVAIYQWGGNAADSPVPALDTGGAPELKIVDIDTIAGSKKKEAASGGEEAESDASRMWPGGVPKRYTIQKNDSVWKLVFRRWRLKDSFVQEIAKANRNLKIEHLQPGAVIKVPNPAGFFRDKDGSKRKAARTRVYEVQIGDTLERIARKHLGRTTRWREIQDLNPGINPMRLQAGQKILLPALR